MAQEQQNEFLDELTPYDSNENESSYLEDLERQLETDLESQFSELSTLEETYTKIGEPDTIGKTVLNVVWEQVINQIGVVAGEDFIKENRGLKLDLSDDAHIQTTQNFESGNIASHNDHINYQERYDQWQSNFEHANDGSLKLHTSRGGKLVANVTKEARQPYDKGRPVGSRERGTDYDHTIPAAEIIRDPGANAHLSQQERVSFANSDANLNEMNSSHNRSKGDTPMQEWLDNPNKKGQKPAEIFDISEELEQKYKDKDKQAREEFAKQKEECEQRSIEAGKQSQRNEAFRIGGKALRAAVMGLLASLIKDIIRKLIVWFKSGKRSLETFLASIKEAIRNFTHNIGQHLITAGNTLITSVATAIFGPIVNLLKKVWIFFKQGYSSVKEAIRFIMDPANRAQPLSIIILEVSKILIAGLTAGGALVLGEVIEKSLLSIPIFAFEIPLFGSLASILGIFFGALVSGIIGAIALNLIDRAIANKQKRLNERNRISTGNQILNTQNKLLDVQSLKLQATKDSKVQNIGERHQLAKGLIQDSINSTQENHNKIESNNNRLSANNEENLANLDQINSLLDSI